MRVKDLMVRDVVSATPKESLRAAGQAMARAGVGVLPVVDRGRRVVGIVTDRDMLLVLASRDARPSELAVGEVMVAPVATCRPDDELLSAVREMESEGLRRLPVVDHDRRLAGILSLDDLMAEARAEADADRLGTLYPNVVRVFQAAVRRRAERRPRLRDAG